MWLGLEGVESRRIFNLLLSGLIFLFVCLFRHDALKLC